MFKNISKLECIVNEKPIQLLCDIDCPIDYVKEALFQFGKYIGHIEDLAKSQAEKAKSDEEKSSEKINDKESS